MVNNVLKKMAAAQTVDSKKISETLPHLIKLHLMYRISVQINNEAICPI
jgi:hypothetical protein